MHVTAVDVATLPGTKVRPRVPARTVLLVASFGAFLAFLDATIVNVAFPNIRESFPDSTISTLSWILNAYSIVFAAFLVVSGRLADLLGRKRAFLNGVLLFTVASVLCAIAPNVEVLIAFRVVQALGAAILVPASLALVVEAFPAEKRAHAIGLWGASAALASGLGPPIGGALVELGNWRWAFLVNLPFGIAAYLAAKRALVESRAPGRRRVPDLLGATISALMLGVLTLGIVKGEDWGWTSAAVIGCFVGSAVLAALFVVSSKRHRSPLLDPALLRIRPFVVGNVATIVAGVGFYAYLLTNILWLQYVWGYSIVVSGLAVVPGALVAAILASRLGPIAQTRGYRLVIIPGAIIWALAYVWYVARVEVTPDFWGAWLPGQILSGIGVGATLPVLGSAALAAVPGGRFATASAVNSSARQIGAVLGIAILVVIVGTPSPTSTVDSLRHGWVFSSICFAFTAVVAVFIGKVAPRTQDDADDDSVRPPALSVPEPAAPAAAATSALGAAPLLSRLPDDVRARLEADAEKVDVAAGTLLFEAGDPADDVYVVTAGLLDVEQDGRVVRQVGAGAVIGELALLTGGTRSASIRARRDSHLLRVTHAAFDDVVGQDPRALRALTTVLATQLQDAAPAPSGRPPQPRLVAVVALHRGAPAEAVADAIDGHLSATSLRVARPGQVEPEALERAEREHDRVLIVAEDPDAAWWAMAVRQADLLVLVAAHDAPVPSEPPLGRTDVDLVLVGAPVPSERVQAWQGVLAPYRITQTKEPFSVGTRALAARIAGRSVGMVMAGGGARAFAHLGILLELEDAGIHVDRVVGASQGSIMAAVHARGIDARTAIEMCHEEFVRNNPFDDYTLPTAAIVKGRKTEKALRRRLTGIGIEELPLLFRCVSTDLQSRAPYVHRTGDLTSAVMASLSIPGMFPPRPDGQRLLADGGVLDNLPVHVLTERDEGPVIAVNIGMGGDAKPHVPGAAPAEPRRVRVPAIGETLMRSLFIGSGGAVAHAREAGAIVVTPSSMGVGLLEFHQLDRMVESGRDAGRALLAEAGHLLR
ncbi:MAG: MDR family MFS transporter/patatin-like phospholipase family protein [Candidatus Nanopelagicales bacterium]